MKLSTKILALLLAVLMAAPLLSVPSFAIEDPYASLKEGIGYLAVGDSFTRGYGAGDNWRDQLYLNDTYGNFECRNVDGSYPNRVAEAFGLDAPDDIRDTSAKLWPLAHDAVSVAYVLDLLGIDDGFRDDEFTYDDGSMLKRYATDLQYFGDPLSLTIDGDAAYDKTGEIMSVRDMFKDASLITIGLGQTDVIYKAQIFGLNTLDTSNAKSALSGIGHIFDLLKKYFNYWKDAYPILLDYIKEVNPDAKVVLVGTLNPIRKATMTDDIAIQIGSLINGIMDAMNAYMRICARKYGYMYVDISDVDTPSSVTQMSLGQIMSISDPIEYALIAHPTQHGYAQIAERVIDAVKKDLENGSPNGLQIIKDHFLTIIDWFRVYFFRAFVFIGSIGQ
jgi:lysophospholipase L1-like esterase